MLERERERFRSKNSKEDILNQLKRACVLFKCVSFKFI